MLYKDVKTESIEANGVTFMFRKLGDPSKAVPVVFLNHLNANLDDWDPRIVNGFAAKHPVVTFDNRGVGASSGATPRTVEEMAEDAITFIKAMGFKEVYLFGFSLGGAVAQEVTLRQPQLVKKLILTGTGGAGAIGGDKITGIAYYNIFKSLVTFTEVRTYLFFTRTANGKQEAKKFLARISERTENRDKKIAVATLQAQLAAIYSYATKQNPPDLSQIKQPTLVANGESDIMIPSVNSAHLALEIPNSKLILYKDAGHGGVFQYGESFVKSVLEFLAD